MAIPFAETVLAGPRLIRRQPIAAGLWILFQLGVSAAGALLLVALAGGPLSQLTRAGDSADPVATLGVFMKIIPAYLLTLSIALAGWAISTTAVLRAVLRPEEGGAGFMKLSLDEVRQFLLMLIWGLIGFAVYLVSAFTAGILVVIVGGAMRAGANTAGPLIIGSVLAVMGAFLLFAVPRFCLASAQTFDMRRVMPFASAGLARGHYWSLLGVWGVTLAISAVVIGVTTGLGGVTNLALGPTHTFSLQESGDMRSLSAYLTPAAMGRLLISAVGLGVLWPLTLAPFAAAYRAIAPAHASSVVGQRVAEVFT